MSAEHPAGSRRRPWSAREDQQLASLVHMLDEQSKPGEVISWTSIGRAIGGRTGKQCRERWQNHMDPTINKGPFTEKVRPLCRTYIVSSSSFSDQTCFWYRSWRRYAPRSCRWARTSGRRLHRCFRDELKIWSKIDGTAHFVRQNGSKLGSGSQRRKYSKERTRQSGLD